MQISLALLLITLCACTTTIYTHGVPNLVEVEPGLWRSGQPSTPEAWNYLQSLGIRSVTKLNFASEGSDDGAVSVGMVVHDYAIEPEGDKDLFDNISNTFVRPSNQILLLIEKTILSGGGVLVHCTHGQDRTGLAIGLHRLHEHVSKKDAYREMLTNHFHPELHGLHEYWENVKE